MRGALCLVHLQDPKGGVRIRCVQCICCLRCKKGVARTLFSTVSEVFYKSMEKARAAGNMLRVSSEELASNCSSRSSPGRLICDRSHLEELAAHRIHRIHRHRQMLADVGRLLQLIWTAVLLLFHSSFDEKVAPTCGFAKENHGNSSSY